MTPCRSGHGRAMSEPTARRVTVSGRVQGVFFRQTCADRARSERVTGWVRNDPEGSVTAHFEGPPEAVEAMVAWCRTGPPAARVERVNVSETRPERLSAFDVRHG